jgi:hypothetical protein
MRAVYPIFIIIYPHYRPNTLQFGTGTEVILTRGDNSFLCLTASDLLPYGFTPDDLNAEKFVSPDSAIELLHA